MSDIRFDWSKEEIKQLFQWPLMELLSKAHQIHRQYFPKGDVQKSKLLSIKTGACKEDCGYCTQSAHYSTDSPVEKLASKEKVQEEILKAKAEGATRFCMGAAWRNPKDKDLEKIAEFIQCVKEAGMESCATLGMLTFEQAKYLKDAGLDYYNHNLDTSPEYYPKVITTRTYEDRLSTLNHVREAGINVCCGGIMGMGETQEDRISFLQQLAIMKPHPESVPINQLEAMKGTPLEGQKELPNFEFLRVIAVARILMPKSRVRLSAGRRKMSSEMQLLCFMAGANSIFIGEKLLTVNNNELTEDEKLFSEVFECAI